MFKETATDSRSSASRFNPTVQKGGQGHDSYSNKPFGFCLSQYSFALQQHIGMEVTGDKLLEKFAFDTFFWERQCDEDKVDVVLIFRWLETVFL